MRTNQDNSGLTPLQEKVIQALLHCPTIKAAATSVGIADRTIRRYMEDPAFQAAYEQAKQDMTGEIRGSMVALSTKAIDALEMLLDNGRSPLAKLGAAKLVLDRIVPELPPDKKQSGQNNEGLISRDLLQYMSDEEVARIEQIVSDAATRRDTQRKVKELEQEARK